MTSIAALGGAAFAASIGWTVMAFARDFGVVPGPWTAATGVPAALSNAGWFLLFALHHSVFARAVVKARVASVVSPQLERPAYVWTSSALLAVVVWRWSPVPGTAWDVGGPLRFGMFGLQCLGLALTAAAARNLGVLQLAGVRPAVGGTPLRDRGLYGFVRHPIYFAWLLMVWPTPTMTGSRLTFSVLTTLYLMVAVPLEERSLRREFGPAYDHYRAKVRWRMLPPLY